MPTSTIAVFDGRRLEHERRGAIVYPRLWHWPKVDVEGFTSGAEVKRLHGEVKYYRHELAKVRRKRLGSSKII